MRVWFDNDIDQIWLEGQDQPYPARSLVASLEDEGKVGIRLLPSGPLDLIAKTAFGNISDQSGAAFASQAAAKAYLDTVFSQQRPTGDRIRVAVNIVALGQRLIPIKDPPQLLNSVRLIVNGVEYSAPDIVASTVAVTWQNPDFPLDAADRVTLAYS